MAVAVTVLPLAAAVEVVGAENLLVLITAAELAAAAFPQVAVVAVVVAAAFPLKEVAAVGAAAAFPL